MVYATVVVKPVREAPRHLHLRGVVALPADRHIGHRSRWLYCGKANRQLLPGNGRAVQAGVGQQPGHRIRDLLVEVSAAAGPPGCCSCAFERNEIQCRALTGRRRVMLPT